VIHETEPRLTHVHPKELEAIVPDLAVPVQPLLEGAERPFAMFRGYWKYDWVLPVHRYDGLEPLLASMAEKVIGPAEAKVKALQERRRRAIEVYVLDQDWAHLRPAQAPACEAPGALIPGRHAP
jgi:hypothetical protein